MEQYSIALQAQAFTAMFILLPVAAALAAWEAGAIRPVTLAKVPNVVGTTRQLFRAIAVVVGLAIACLTACYLTIAGLALPNAAVAVPGFAVMVAACLLGGAVGLVIPRVVAVPVCLTLGYVFMVFPQAWAPYWLRDLNGTYSGCCAVNETLDPRATWAALIFAAALALTALMLASAAKTIAKILASLLLATVALAAAGQVAGAVAPAPVVARHASLICQRADVTTFCVWPEHQTQLGHLLTVGTRVIRSWRIHGLAAPSLFTEGTSTNGAVFGTRSEASSQDLVGALVEAVSPPFPACAATHIYAGETHRQLVGEWLLAASGYGQPATDSVVSHVLRTSRGAQIRWLGMQVRETEKCGSARSAP